MKRNLFKLCYADSVQFTKTVSIAGINFAESTIISTGEVFNTDDIAVLPAQPGTLTTRSDANTGTLTMTNSSHGIITGQRVDLYFSNGLCQRNVTVGTVSGVSVPIDLGIGDNLPIATTAVKVGIAVKRAFPVVGNNVLIMAFQSPVEANFTIVDGSEVEQTHFYNAGGKVNSWHSTDGTTNPLAGVTSVSIWVSHSDTTASHDLQAAAVRSA